MYIDQLYWSSVPLRNMDTTMRCETSMAKPLWPPRADTTSSWLGYMLAFTYSGIWRELIKSICCRLAKLDCVWLLSQIRCFAIVISSLPPFASMWFPLYFIWPLVVVCCHVLLTYLRLDCSLFTWVIRVANSWWNDIYIYISNRFRCLTWYRPFIWRLFR